MIHNSTLIFTDGASRGNPGPGGWGAILILPSKNEENHESGIINYEVKEIGGRAEFTTNNRMELTAVIQALSIIHNSGFLIQIYSDSKYLINGITDWIFSWQKSGWINSKKQPVENQDLWKTLFSLTRGKKIEWRYVAGHSGYDLNERCDEIATTFADGKIPELYSNVLKNYRIDIREALSEDGVDEVSGAKSTPFYISLVEGQVQRHVTWAECEKRVKGASGAKFKKVKNNREAEKVVREWDRK